jgi:hypothetical protein
VHKLCQAVLANILLFQFACHVPFVHMCLHV